jgi:type I restriction enzyme, S subunit
MSLNLDKTRWRHVSLGETAATSKEKVDPTDGSVDRYLAGEHMDTNELQIHRWGDVRDVDLGPAFHRRFRPGQVLYGSRRTYLRKVGVPDFDGVCANTTFVVETKDENVLSQEFLPFVMTAEPFHAFAIRESKGSVNPYVNWSDIERYKFDLPPVAEQKRIADLLWPVERHRDSLRAESASTLSALTAFLARQLAATTGEMVTLADLCASVIGGVWGSPEGESEVDALALGPRVYAGGAVELRVDDSPVRSISAKQAESRLICEGDIILERSGGSRDQAVGRVVIAGPDLPNCIPTDFQRLIRPNVRLIEPRYLFWKLRLDWHMGLTRSYSKRTTNIINLSVPDYLDRKLRIPARDEQMRLIENVDAFTRALSEIDSELAAVGSFRSAVLADIFGVM